MYLPFYNVLSLFRFWFQQFPNNPIPLPKTKKNLSAQLIFPQGFAVEDMVWKCGHYILS